MITTVNNNDIQQISKLLDDRLDKKFDEKLAPIQKTLSGHGKMLESHGRILESHDTAIKSIGQTLKSHGRILRSLKKDQSTMLAMLDGEQMKQSKRLEKVENQLGL